MTFRPCLGLLALVLLARTAFAGPGLNLYVGDCSAGATAAAYATSACTSNTGTAITLVGSIVLPQTTVPQFVGAQSILTVQLETNVPDWWRLDGYQCRGSMATMTGDFTVSPSCPTLWDNHPAAGSAWACLYPAAEYPLTTLKLVTGTVLNSTDVYDLTGDGTTELGLFKFAIPNGKTTGTGACAGCNLRADITLVEVDLEPLTATSSNDYLKLKTPVTASSNRVGWQYNPTPTVNRTWGAIKAMYR